MIQKYLIVLVFVYFSNAFAAMNVGDTEITFTFRQNKISKSMEIKNKKDKKWKLVSDTYQGSDDDFYFHIGLKLQDGKVFLLSKDGEELNSFNAGIHKQIQSSFLMGIAWKKNDAFIFGNKVGGNKSVTNCETILVSSETFINNSQYRILKIIVELRNFSNKIFIKDARTSGDATCWCQVKRIQDDKNE